MRNILLHFTIVVLFKPLAATATTQSLAELAARFQPLFHFHSQETIFPDDPDRFLAATGLREGRFNAPSKNGGTQADNGAPLFWRTHLTSQRQRVIEYWYFAPYSEAHLLGIGSHWGDWEGVAAVVSEGTTPRLLAVYAAAHEWGKWHCAAQLGPQLEVFAGLGSHASYALANGALPWPRIDRLNGGHVWRGTLRELEAQPFYNYKGRWGSSQLLTLSFAPFAPSETKRLPRGDVNAVDQEIASVVRKCNVPVNKLAKFNGESSGL